jgi:hypothetical protein
MTHYISEDTRVLLAEIVTDAFDAGAVSDEDHDNALRGLGYEVDNA